MLAYTPTTSGCLSGNFKHQPLVLVSANNELLIRMKITHSDGKIRRSEKRFNMHGNY